MDSKTLALIVKGIDEASSTLRDVKGEVKGLGSEAATTTRDLQPLGRGLSAVGAAGAALISITALTAARVEVLGTVLSTVGDTAGYTQGQLDAFEQGVTSLGITTGAARQGLVQMMQAELDLAEATDIASIAQDAAVIASVNSSAAYETLVRGLLTGRPVLLKSLGLTVDFNAAYKRQAELLGISTRDLDANQKMQARLNEVKRTGAIIEGTYEAAMGDVGKKLTSMPRLLEEAAAGLGEAYLPAMEGAVDITSEMLEAFIALKPEQQAAAANFLLVGTGVTTLAGASILLLPQILAISGAVGTVLASAAFAAIAPIAGLAAAAAALYAALDKVGGAAGVVKDIPPGMDELVVASVLLDGTIGSLTQTNQEALDAFRGVGIATSDLADGWTGYYSPALIAAREQTTGWEANLLGLKQPLADAALGTQDFGGAAGNAATGVGALAISTGAFAGSLDELDFKNEEMWGMALAAGANNTQMLDLAVSVGTLTKAEADLKVKEWELAQAWVDGRISLTEYHQGMADLRREAADTGEEIGTLGPIATLAGKEIPEGLRKAQYGFDDVNRWAKDTASWIDGIPRDLTITTHYGYTGTPPSDVGPPGGGGTQEYQHGTPYVPRTGYAYLHEGEAVLTREENRHRGEGGSRVTIINNFGRDSVRSDEDIQYIIDAQQQVLELQGLRGRIV